MKVERVDPDVFDCVKEGVGCRSLEMCYELTEGLNFLLR